jgi:integrase
MHKTAVDVLQGVHVPESTSITVKDAASIWLEHIGSETRAGRLEPTTDCYYGTHIRLHVLNSDIGVGAIKLANLNRRNVLAFKDRLLESRSEAMIRRVISTLAMVIDHSRELGFATKNEARGIKIRRTKRTKARVQIPDAAHVRTLLDRAREPMRQILIIAAFCGLRASEIYGLRWEDVGLAEKVIRVRQRADCHGKMGEPKSASGMRDVPFGPFVENTLKEWKLKTGGQGLVFQNGNGRPLLHSNVRHRWFAPLFFEVGETGTQQRVLPHMRFHDLRHFAVSLWIREGFGPKALTEFAGHSSVSMTYDRYGHLFSAPEDNHNAMARAEKFVLGL